MATEKVSFDFCWSGGIERRERVVHHLHQLNTISIRPVVLLSSNKRINWNGVEERFIFLLLLPPPALSRVDICIIPRFYVPPFLRTFNTENSLRRGSFNGQSKPPVHHRPVHNHPGNIERSSTVSLHFSILYVEIVIALNVEARDEFVVVFVCGCVSLHHGAKD